MCGVLRLPATFVTFVQQRFFRFLRSAFCTESAFIQLSAGVTGPAFWRLFGLFCAAFRAELAV